jgi:hypothetical protein
MVSPTPNRPLQTVCRSAIPQRVGFLLQGFTRASKPWATAVIHPVQAAPLAERPRHSDEAPRGIENVPHASKTQVRSFGASSVIVVYWGAPRHTSMLLNMSFIVTNSPRCTGQHASHWPSPQSPGLFSAPPCSGSCMASSAACTQRIRCRNRNLVSLPRCHWPSHKLPCECRCWFTCALAVEGSKRQPECKVAPTAFRFK